MMVPKRQSQTACGIPHSAANHWYATLAGKSTVEIPGGTAIELEEQPEEELLVCWGKESEEGVIVEATAEAEVFPPVPDMVGGLVSCFLLCIKDDSTVCSTCVTQHKILLGSGEMSKLGGIWEGIEAWKCWVRTWLDGLSAASEWGFPRAEPV